MSAESPGRGQGGLGIAAVGWVRPAPESRGEAVAGCRGTDAQRCPASSAASPAGSAGTSSARRRKWTVPGEDKEDESAVCLLLLSSGSLWQHIQVPHLRVEL